MTKTFAGHMIELHLSDQLRLERLPFCRAICCPATRSAGSASREARRRDQFLQFLRQRFALGCFDSRTKANVVQQASLVVEAEQQRADNVFLLRVTKSADQIGRASCRERV